MRAAAHRLAVPLDATAAVGADANRIDSIFGEKRL
jgi:hypothetical protein